MSAAPLRLAVLFLALAGTVAAPALAQLGSGEIRGRAPQVIDSGLIDFAGQAVYLYGLRGIAPETTCGIGDESAGRTWACGQEARWAASNRIANHWVDCVERARGAAGEIFAVCYLGGVGGPELNAWLVEQGWALAASDYADDYVAAEATARAAGRGLWRGR
ncbi:MAG: thermonuclease family protein [Kiloniellaceae bacterium]